MQLTKEALLKSQEKWLCEENDTDEWYEKGINLYKQLSKVDHFNFAHYNKQQANLLLEQARHEKTLQGNMQSAERLLKRVIDLQPDHPEIYYRLAFINAHFKKWEAILFYANEALEHGLSLEEEIKLSALMGHAYHQIGLKRRGKEQFDHAESLDSEKEWSLFIGKYKELDIERHTRQQREERDESIELALEKTRKNLCCILSLYSQQNYFITSDHEITLSLKEAELLSLLIQTQDKLVSSGHILIHVWPELALENPNSTVVKRNISSLRAKLSQAFNEYPGMNLIRFEDYGYKMYLPVEALVFKGVNFRRLSCR